MKDIATLSEHLHTLQHELKMQRAKCQNLEEERGLIQKYIDDSENLVAPLSNGASPPSREQHVQLTRCLQKYQSNLLMLYDDIKLKIQESGGQPETQEAYGHSGKIVEKTPKKIRWMVSERLLIYFFKELENKKFVEKSHEWPTMLARHFEKRDGTPFNPTSLSNQKDQMYQTQTTPRGAKEIDSLLESKGKL